MAAVGSLPDHVKRRFVVVVVHLAPVGTHADLPVQAVAELAGTVAEHGVGKARIAVKRIGMKITEHLAPAGCGCEEGS